MKPITEARGGAQLVTGVGNEVGPHPFDVFLLGLIVKQQQDEVRPSPSQRFGGKMDWCHPGFIETFGVALQRILDLLDRTAIKHIVERCQHVRLANAERQRVSFLDIAEDGRAGGVGKADDAATVENEAGIRQGGGQLAHVDVRHHGQSARLRTSLEARDPPAPREKSCGKNDQPHDDTGPPWLLVGRIGDPAKAECSSQKRPACGEEPDQRTIVHEGLGILRAA